MTSSGTPASTVARFAKFFSTSVTSSPTTCLVLEITPNFAGWQPAAAIPISDLVSIAPSVLRKVITSLHTAIHPAGTIHGDLKMTNILIAPAAAPDVASPDVALIDYGLSVPIGTRFANGVPVVIAPTTTSSSSLPSFIVALPSQSCGNAAPEIIMGLLADGILPVAPSNDIWAIGMLVADMAIGLRWTGTPMNAFDSIFAATADGSTNAAIIAAANKDIEEYYETQTGSYIETRHHQRFRSTLGFSTTATSADQHPWDKMFCSSLLKIFCVFGTPDSTTDPTSIYYQNPLFAALPQIPRPTSSRDAFFRAVIFAGDGLLHHRSNYNHTDVFAVAERLYENPTIRSAWDVVMQACQLDMPNEELAKLAHQELRCAFPETCPEQYLQSWVIKERRATMDHTPKNEALRPNFKTPIPNFWLAGDWTNTKLPCTLEGACYSGFHAAEQLINSVANQKQRQGVEHVDSVHNF
jgi:serine/threonine protein kinase